MWPRKKVKRRWRRWRHRISAEIDLTHYLTLVHISKFDGDGWKVMAEAQASESEDQERRRPGDVLVSLSWSLATLLLLKYVKHVL